MKLEVGQKWISEEYPHEDFEIYDGIIDTCVDSFEDESLSFDKQPETTKVFFWKRINKNAFNEFLSSKGKKETSFPYAWYGESKKGSLVSKIKKYKMVSK